eukprot:3730881-Prorocentrum_lima.AAC.1
MHYPTVLKVAACRERWDVGVGSMFPGQEQMRLLGEDSMRRQACIAAQKEEAEEVEDTREAAVEGDA